MTGQSHVVRYAVDESTTVEFEVDPSMGFRPAGADEVVGRVQEAIEPAVEAAKVVLGRVRQAEPGRVELRFGIKVSGAANWLIARAAAEGNFEVTLIWEPRRGHTAESSVSPG